MSSELRPDAFAPRHIGPSASEQAAMLADLGLDSLESLVAQVIPDAIRHRAPLALPEALSEWQALASLKDKVSVNRLTMPLIGLGYYDTVTPPVLVRNVIENPGWYTAYTPYQAEIAQGRLEALLNFQTMVMDLTGMDIANASLLDEATAAAEAMAMARRVNPNGPAVFFADEACFPQTLDVLATRARGLDIELVVGPWAQAAQHQPFGILVQNPGRDGELRDLAPWIAAWHESGAVVAVVADLLSLTLVESPGAQGADMVLGSSQRFGVPLGFGGPHAAFFACRDAYKRAMPGRIIGVSVDARGGRALRMALQTREQHIRREKANSNICTSQVLLANLAGMYAVYHGPQGLRRIAQRIHGLASRLAASLQAEGVAVQSTQIFDTVTFAWPDADAAWARLHAAGYSLRRVDGGHLGLSVGERCTAADAEAMLRVLFGREVALAAAPAAAWPEAWLRQSPYLTHPVFNRYHSETEMMRYLKKLEMRDLALNQAMIPLGSCTMKLNAAAEMLPITWPEINGLHPFAPLDDARGLISMMDELAQALAVITGFDAVSLQPNSGAQGEYAGLMAIRDYYAAEGQAHRTVCLIPKSAHGTNPASAQLAGLQVVVVDCDAQGNVDVADLQRKAEQHADKLACLMLTYPSTHGVFEEAVRDICAIVHQHGGQVYMDGANMNALVALAQPAALGADVSHINLHKTFCIPHGGGGPGMGPIGVRAHLAPYLPGHVLQAQGHRQDGAVSAAPWGSASILPISWMYVRMMGAEGLKLATEVALLNANYVAQHLAADYPLLYTGAQGRVAHECIIDLRPIKAATGITEVDVAKRLMDYGFHAPTMSFPVAGTFMIEPTESESKAELDRFIRAMQAIRAEIRQVEQGVWPADNNPLKHAPHTQADVLAETWDRPYSRLQAVMPAPENVSHKYWPSVNRIDDVYGDRNLFCSCVLMDELAD